MQLGKDCGRFHTAFGYEEDPPAQELSKDHEWLKKNREVQQHSHDEDDYYDDDVHYHDNVCVSEVQHDFWWSCGKAYRIGQARISMIRLANGYQAKCLIMA